MSLRHLSRQDRRAARHYLREKQALYGDEWRDIPPSEWPHDNDSLRFKVLANKKFLVQLYREATCVRITVNRMAVDSRGNWLDGITWDELQAIKDDVGYADYDAVEVYPRSQDVVNVSNMRHLWVIPRGLPFAWRK